MLVKNWDRHVVDAEEIARGSGFRDLRERIMTLAHPQPDEVLVDVGAGTGLLALAFADAVQRVWALDISSGMVEYLRAKAASAGLENVQAVVASAVSLPLVEDSADLVVSNYCFHHLDADGKRRAIAEIARVLRPGGRLIFGDMMFELAVSDPRNREVVRAKVGAMLRKGPAGVVRLARNGARLATGRWEHPAGAEWWRTALRQAGFVDVEIELLAHEGGIACARLP